MDDLVDRKAKLRADVTSRRDCLPEDQRQAAAVAACARLVDLIDARAARRVALFAGMRSELDPRAAADRLRASGRQVAYPRVVGPRRLSFHVTDHESQLLPGRFGIAEPDPSWPEIAFASLDVVVLPGLAFDRRGGRLGWGGGYYDSVLASPSSALRVAFLHSIQLVDIVPRGPTDQLVDVLIDELGTWPTERGCAP